MTGGLAAVVVVALVLPVAISGGLLTKVAAGDFKDLPEALKNPPTPQSSYIYASDGKTLITSFFDQNRRDVSYEEIPQVMREAIVASEDTRFYEHKGVDPKGVLRAFVSNVGSGGVSQGASTLTMQYVRNVLLYTANSEAEQKAATEQSAGRKLQEMQYALSVEKELSKEEILRRYLNLAYFGHGAYGIYSASQTYYSKNPKDLTLDEASLLAGLVQAPDTYDPAKNTKDSADRRGWVLKRMVDMKYVDEAAATAAQAKPVTLKLKNAPDDCLANASGDKAGWGFFCGYFKEWWLAQPAFGATTADRQANLQRGGYTIVTSLDPDLQRAAEKNIADQLKKDNPLAMNLAVVEPGTGRIKAMATNRNYSVDIANNGRNTAGEQYGKGSYPNTVNPLVAGGKAASGYQAGSTFKMFTMLAALEQGMPLSTAFDSPTKYRTKFPVEPGPAACDGRYCPANSSPSWMDGRRTMWDAFGRSVNTYFVWLEEQVGPEKAVEMAKRLGIQFRAKTDADLANNPSQWGAFTLGVSSTSPLDLANAYATLAAEGTYCTPLPVTSVTDHKGEQLDVAQPKCTKVLDPDIARAATDAARCPVGDQNSFGKCNGGTAEIVRSTVGRDVAGKTGTSDKDSTGTLAVYTPNLAVAGIVADPDNPQNYAGSANAQKVNLAVARTVRDGVKALPDKDFNPPSRKIALGSQGNPDNRRAEREESATVPTPTVNPPAPPSRNPSAPPSQKPPATGFPTNFPTNLPTAKPTVRPRL